MAAPNILAATTATPHTVSITPADTARNALVTAPATGAAQKINEIIVSNIDGTTYRAIASTISVPPDASLIVSDKTTMFYLLDTSVTGEASTLWATSSTASKLTYSVSYETVS